MKVGINGGGTNRFRHRFWCRKLQMLNRSIGVMRGKASVWCRFWCWVIREKGKNENEAKRR